MRWKDSDDNWENEGVSENDKQTKDKGDCNQQGNGDSEHKQGNQKKMNTRYI